VWSRILRGEAPIAWSGGMYTPDFYAQVGEVHYLIEVKANRDMEDAEVLAKKEEARRLARVVTDEGNHGTWGYLLISQQALDTAKNVGDLLRIAAT
jgi:type III restriction enzyme